MAVTRARCGGGRTTWLATVDHKVAGITDLEADGHVDTLNIDAGRGSGSAHLRLMGEVGFFAGSEPPVYRGQQTRPARPHAGGLAPGRAPGLPGARRATARSRHVADALSPDTVLTRAVDSAGIAAM